MEEKETKKSPIKIDDLPQKPLTPDEEDATKGGIYTGGIAFGGPLHGTSTPRADTTYTDPDDVDNKSP